MHEYIIQLVENKVVFYGLLVLILLVFLRSGWALGSSFTRKKAKKQFKEMEKEKNIFLAITEKLLHPKLAKNIILNEFIEITRMFSEEKSVAFCNGVLSNALSEIEIKREQN